MFKTLRACDMLLYQQSKFCCEVIALRVRKTTRQVLQGRQHQHALSRLPVVNGGPWRVA